MPLINWSDDLKLGIQTIDNEHEALIGLMNEFYYAIVKDESNKIIKEKLHMLLCQANDHFSHEEEIMHANNYPDQKEHLKEHAELRTQLMHLEAEFKKQANQKLANETFSFLKRWVMGHLLHTDNKLSKHLKKQGFE